MINKTDLFTVSIEHATIGGISTKSPPKPENIYTKAAEKKNNNFIIE